MMSVSQRWCCAREARSATAVDYVVTDPAQLRRRSVRHSAREAALACDCQGRLVLLERSAGQKYASTGWWTVRDRQTEMLWVRPRAGFRRWFGLEGESH